MHCNYSDIINKISEKPTWFDENAVPRYCPFEVGKQANVYAYEVCLLEIACQHCGTKFLVTKSRDIDLDYNIWKQTKIESLHSFPEIPKEMLYFGDPPNIGCCISGPTAASIPLLVVEYWSRNKNSFKWEKVLENEQLINGYLSKETIDQFNIKII